ncbi:MAG: hypothetical protein OEM02_01850 [Desulfobulbaceae bacterium]|nr:hypothetical protein [Desulfobulbaceae bacterium]
MNKEMQIGRQILLLVLLLLFATTEQLIAEDVYTTDWKYPKLSDIPTGIPGYGTGEPPFLGVAIDPNLLIVLDNSGSMYDPAYVETPGECHASDYDDTEIYAGYFVSNLVYKYDISNNRFEVVANTTDPTTVCPSAEVTYLYKTPGTLCVGGEDDLTTNDTNDIIGDLEQVTRFGATGNFLNWLAASKFDIEKKILTGGKWDINPDLDMVTNDGSLVMESRGCSNRRFVKEITAYKGADTTVDYYLTFGVRPPQEEVIDRWDGTKNYAINDKVLYNGVFYIALLASSGVTPVEGVSWTYYYDSRWYPNVDYAAGAIVYDYLSGNMYRTKSGGTSRSDALELAYDTAVDWELYNLTHIEFYPASAVGFDYNSCQLALEEMKGSTLVGDSTDDLADDTTLLGGVYKNSRLGRLKYYTELCMGYPSGGSPKTLAGYSKAAYNHSMQECWYYSKFGHFQPGGGSVSSIKKACEGVYDYISPEDLTPWDNSYICAGQYGITPPDRYIGRCWEVAYGDCVNVPCDTKHVVGDEWLDPSSKEWWKCNASSEIEKCVDLEITGQGNNKVYTCVDGIYTPKQECEASALITPHWTDDNFLFYDDCIYGECTRNQCVTAYCSADNAATGNTCTYEYALDVQDPVVEDDPCPETWASATMDFTRDVDTVDLENWWLYDDAANSVQGEDGYFCVDQALRDFCKFIEIPEIIDPSDSTGLTGTVWNAPAILVDSGIAGQIGKPLLEMKGYILHLTPPTGVLQAVSDKLRIGLMTFNDNGAKAECLTYASDPTDPISYNCPDEGNRDGSKIVTYIDNDPEGEDSHETELIDGINDIKAVAWTPLAEAMFNAIGYYAQKSSMRLDSEDFNLESEITSTVWSNGTTYAVDDVVTFAYKPSATEDTVNYRYVATSAGISTVVDFDIDGDGTIDNVGPKFDTVVVWKRIPNSLDPVQHWCQSNNILILTEGASTADVNDTVTSFVSSHTMDDDQVDDQGCQDGLYGSTFMDDFTYYGYKEIPSSLYANSFVSVGDTDEKQNISTYIVSTGTLRDTTGVKPECNPKVLMEDAAEQGRFYEPGTTPLLQANSAEQLARMLTFVFSEIMNRASAGSAASVISSSRGGEGAVYQAIFWPEQGRNLGADESKLKWSGDVHALFLGPGGYLFEDTNQDGLFYTQDKNGNGILDPAEDVNGDGVIEPSEDVNGNGILDPSEDVNGNGILDPNEDLNFNGTLDPAEDINNNGILDVGEDLDGDGILDPAEDLNNNGVLDLGEDLDFDGELDLSEDTNNNGVLDLGEDLNGNGILDPTEDLDGSGDIGDKRVIIYFDAPLGESRACYQGFVPAPDPNSSATCDPDFSVNIRNVEYIWSANKWLSSLTDNELVNNRPVDIDGHWIFTNKSRYIFTWNDVDNDGIVDKSGTEFGDSNDEVFPFTEAVDWGAFSVSADREAVVYDFDKQTDAEVDKLISWMRGKDQTETVDEDNDGVPDDANGDGIDDIKYVMRDRRYFDNKDNALITWRLGDIIHSTPTLVAKPAEYYDLLYKDRSYLKFAGKYNNRRHVIYFGANDGMMHAMNAGFYSSQHQGFFKCPTEDRGTIDTATNSFTASYLGTDCDNSKSYAELGEELWAYVPYNLLPHLDSMTKDSYVHKYYVDAPPRMFDVQIFVDDCIYKDGNGDPLTPPNCDSAKHPGGWGTILVGSMRFGGAPIEMQDVVHKWTGADPATITDNRRMQSSYFILDITDPEGPPELLGEMTRNTTWEDYSTLGYTTPMPTIVPMHKGKKITWDSVTGTQVGPYSGASLWYLVMGSGPSSVRAENDRLHAKLGILPLEWLQGKILTTDTTTNNEYLLGSRKPFRIPKVLPSDLNGQGGTFDLHSYISFSSTYAFVSDLITMDFDLGSDNSYKADALYFGTVEGKDFEYYSDDPNTTFDESTTTEWDKWGGGRIIRLVTRDQVTDANGIKSQVVTKPSEWVVKEFMNVRRPITGAPTVGTDGVNYWVYFGSGRFFDPKDKTDKKTQYFFGVKEPKGFYETQEDMLWGKVTSWDVSDKDDLKSYALAPGNSPGHQGLVRSDKILVASAEYTTSGLPEIWCYDDNFISLSQSNCPLDASGDPITTFPNLLEYIVGEKYGTPPSPDIIGVDGWYREMNETRERNVSQATLLGGLVTFSTYQPYESPCKAEGDGYLYGVHYQTGTAWTKSVFGIDDIDVDKKIIKEKTSTGVGLTGTPSLYTGDPPTGDAKAFVQTSTGEILEISQENLPYQNFKSGRSTWMYLDTQGN